MASNRQDSLSGDVKGGKTHKNKKTKLAVSKVEASTGQLSKLKEFNDIFFSDTLDQTADFSGGFTPYRKIALKKQNLTKGLTSKRHPVEKGKDNAVRKTNVRQNLRRKKIPACADGLIISDKEGAGDKIDAGSGSDLGLTLRRDTRVPKEQLPATVSEKISRKENETASSCTLSQNPGKTSIGDVDKNVVETSAPSPKPGGSGTSATRVSGSKQQERDHEEEGKLCGTCGKDIPVASYQAHLSLCLRERFQRAKKPVPLEEDTMDTERNAVRESEFVICQFCQEDITGIDIEERQQHVQKCLEEHGLVTPRKDKSRAGQVLDHVDGTEAERTVTLCHLCGKDLGHLNTQRHAQHVNRCIDQREKEEEKKKEEAAALQRARNKVLDCPICGQRLKTLNSRKSHLKKCSNNFKIPLAVLKERVKEQEEEHQLKLSAGILPEEKRPAKRGRSRKDAQGTGSNGPRNTANVVPDEATQLALALSTSLKEEEERKIRESLGEFVVPSALPSGLSGPTNLDAFSILMSPSKPRSPKKKKVPTATLR